MSELRECPWPHPKGQMSVDSPGTYRHYVFCHVCGAHGPEAGSRSDAITAWNTRPASRVVEAAKKFLRCVEEYHDAIKLRDDLENRHLWSRELSAMYDATVTLRAALAAEGEEG